MKTRIRKPRPTIIEQPFKVENNPIVSTDTVEILRELGIDYFSHNKEGMTNLDNTEYSAIFNQWISVGWPGAAYRVELAKRLNDTLSVVLEDCRYDDIELVSEYPFTEEGIRSALSEMADIQAEYWETLPEEA